MDILYNLKIDLLLLYEKFCYKYCRKCGEIVFDGECDFCGNRIL